jgi:hypothetical protein
VIADNIRSINAARELLSVSEQYNISLMNGLVLENEEQLEELPVGPQEELVSSFENLSKSFATPQERAAADSVLYAYAAYMQVVSEAQEMWRQDYAERQHWFFNRLQPVYNQLIDYIEQLTFTCQDTLIANSQNMQERFQRSIMPPLVSLLLGLMLVLLFNYYLNYYLINPLLKVTKGIQGYRRYNKPYNVTLDTLDEISELNETVKDIIDVNESYKAQLRKEQARQ